MKELFRCVYIKLYFLRRTLCIICPYGLMFLRRALKTLYSEICLFMIEANSLYGWQSPKINYLLASYNLVNKNMTWHNDCTSFNDKLFSLISSCCIYTWCWSTQWNTTSMAIRTFKLSWQFSAHLYGLWFVVCINLFLNYNFYNLFVYQYF